MFLLVLVISFVILFGTTQGHCMDQMTPTKNGCSSEPGPAKAALSFTSAEIRYLKQSWETASSTMDIGCELVARLLNDNRTRFRALIETHSGDVLGSANFTAEDVKKYRRARAVGAGVVTFFNQVISKVDSPDAADFIANHSQRLGASHFQMKVWFQAENWLCVKNCLLETIMAALAMKRKGSRFCLQHVVSMDTKKGRECWYKVIQYVIQNMKKGFLNEALSSADSSSTSSNASV